MQVEEVDWDCSKLIEVVEVNMVEIQGIWAEEYEILKSFIAIWRILPKGMSELKKGILEDDVANITRSKKHYKLSFLEKDHPGRNVEEGSKLIGLNVKEEKEEEDRVLTKIKNTQAHVMVCRLLMASHKHCNALLDALNGKEVPIETTSLSLPFLMENFLPKEPLILDLCKSLSNAWVLRFQWFLLKMDLH